MINDKSVSVGDNSFTANRTVMGVTSRQKFQNMEKLTNIVRQMEQNSSRPAHPEQILEAIKNNIKNSYNKLYDNYEANKNTILKSIQQTETNDANEGAMKQKFQSVLKEKNSYDRLKVEVEKKQKKLKKLMEIRDQALLLTTTKQGLKDTLSDRAEAIRTLEDHRNMLEYESAVLEGMKKQREQIKLSLKQRNDNLLKEEQLKKERTKKIIDTSHTKKIILDQIEQKIRQQDLCEIPLPLSEELERKLQQYQGKYTQQNILIHEKYMNEQKTKREKIQADQEQEEVRKAKQAKEKQQNRQYEVAYNHFLLKQAEQEQIKKFCRVQSITQIANGSVEEEKSNLQLVRQEIEREIKLLNEDNKKIRQDIEKIMTSLESRKADGATFLELQKIYESQQTQLRRIKSHALKKQKTILQWEGVLQTLFPVKNDKMSFMGRLKNSIPKYEEYSMRAHGEGSTAPDTTQLKPNLGLIRRQKELRKSYQNDSSQASEFQI